MPRILSCCCLCGPLRFSDALPDCQFLQAKHTCDFDIAHSSGVNRAESRQSVTGQTLLLNIRWQYWRVTRSASTLRAICSTQNLGGCSISRRGNALQGSGSIPPVCWADDVSGRTALQSFSAYGVQRNHNEKISLNRDTGAGSTINARRAAVELRRRIAGCSFPVRQKKIASVISEK